MRIINLIVVHCSATRGDCTLSPEEWIKQCPYFDVAKEFGNTQLGQRV